MDTQPKSIDRRRYEKRAVAVKVHPSGRPLSETVKTKLQNQLIMKHGDGWELDSVYHGSIMEPLHSSEEVDSQVLIFKRRRQLRDE